MCLHAPAAPRAHAYNHHRSSAPQHHPHHRLRHQLRYTLCNGEGARARAWERVTTRTFPHDEHAVLARFSALDLVHELSVGEDLGRKLAALNHARTHERTSAPPPAAKSLLIYCVALLPQLSSRDGHPSCYLPAISPSPCAIHTRIHSLHSHTPRLQTHPHRHRRTPF